MTKWALFLFMLMLLPGCRQGEQTGSRGIDREVDLLLGKMTLREKIGQMSQIDVAALMKRVDPHGGFYGPFLEPNVLDKDSLQKYIVEYGISCVFNIGPHGYSIREWHGYIKEIQDYALHRTRLGIPVLYGVDAMHGASLTVGATLFPQQLAMASTWNPDLVKQAAEITAYEMRASNLPLTFGPSLDLGKHPVWSRLNESFGEDVLLTTILSKSTTEGMEGPGNSVDDKTRIATSIKHYIAYSFPLTGKDRTPAWFPEHYVREYFLPPFTECIRSGVHIVLLNSGELNGVPLHADKYWLKNVLRDEIGFDGIIMSDWYDIEKLNFFHHVAPTYKEAIIKALDAGIDMVMVPLDNRFMDLLTEIVNEGSIAESRIDESVRRILKLKYKLGLFEHPYRNPDEYPDFGSAGFRHVASQCALESVVLLKNADNILPLDRNLKVLVTGPAANTMSALNGGWTYSWQGHAADTYASEKNTILEAVRNELGADKLIYEPGSGFDSVIDINKAVKAAGLVDCIILCLGEPSYAETPGYIEDLYLPDAQTDLALAMAATGKPVILVLTEGRPRLISRFEEQMEGVLLSFLPGNEGGDALACVIFGDYNPNGKLPVTYPRYPNDLINYDHRYSERADHQFGNNHGYHPQYPFGYGLSYTSFGYANLQLSKDTIGPGDSLVVAVDIKNTGKVNGYEVAQLYIRDVYANLTPPFKRLRAFNKIFLFAGEQKTVRFIIQTEDLNYVGQDNQWTIEEGEFEVCIENLTTNFYLQD
ncbi:MAG: glycoside hydrolase family 3 C-terminal domain-containing protein [Bacteroidales bacterium]|nr:glycoside hydrolase family 3 C-terminal domain-containing protein [Bacteroidales bacterium]